MFVSDLEKFLKREKRRADFYRNLEAVAIGVGFGILAYGFGLLLSHILFGFRIPLFLTNSLPMLMGCIGLGLALPQLARSLRKSRATKLSEIASTIERQSDYFKGHRESKSELVSAASFLELPSIGEFEKAHIHVWSRKLPLVAIAHIPRASLAIVLFTLGVILLSGAKIQQHISYSLPSWTRPWAPTGFEVRLPFANAEWHHETGAIAGIAGSVVQFDAPQFRPLRTFLFVRETENEGDSRWTMKPCEDRCELKLRGRGQYAVGTLFWRSPMYPLQVSPDEIPKGALLARVDGEWVAANTLEILNKKDLDIQGSASDDVQLKKVELVHRFQETTEILKSWDLQDPHFKADYPLSMEGWKGGAHEIFLKMSDEIQSADSSPLTILYADEETLREKRLQSLRALLDEWVHVLGDLLETDYDQKLKEGLEARLRAIEYPEVEENSLINAYVKELRALGQRIENWARLSPNILEVKDLTKRSEKAILYGLSLIFQEKTGDVEATADHLKNSQNDLSKLLQDLKEGKLDLSSKELEEAFQKLAKQLEDLQNKIKELPQGPQDELLNREALEAQAEESQTLADKIEEIKKQMASGDNKGAMRELESLLNQLSILSKEMERTLDQWKSNLDQGAMQAQEKFMKKLQDLKKRQEELAQKTDKVKERSEQLESESQKTWKPVDPEKQKQFEKEFKKLEADQDKLKKDFEQSTQEFEKNMEGSEWQQVFQNSEMQDLQKGISDRMTESKEGLAEQKAFDSLTQQREAIELMNKLGEGQKQLRDQAQSSKSPAQGNRSEKVEIKSNDKQLNAERRRKIMESLRQKVDEKFQKSHEHYFEELLQR